ncbi:Hypothetical predicted protein [Cloeon dipterum]|uniref:Bee-milk protein n=1 Tax=Cloeon dipterum TaxID=197152 RepID=A0A8S1CY63_9INSE|nr:Hypothetical predicted protein [Cloeon dipterum]
MSGLSVRSVHCRPPLGEGLRCIFVTLLSKGILKRIKMAACLPLLLVCCFLCCVDVQRLEFQVVQRWAGLEWPPAVINSKQRLDEGFFEPFGLAVSSEQQVYVGLPRHATTDTPSTLHPSSPWTNISTDCNPFRSPCFRCGTTAASCRACKGCRKCRPKLWVLDPKDRRRNGSLTHRFGEQVAPVETTRSKGGWPPYDAALGPQSAGRRVQVSTLAVAGNRLFFARLADAKLFALPLEPLRVPNQLPEVEEILSKSAPSTKILSNNAGVLYFDLEGRNAIATWDTNREQYTEKIIHWTDGQLLSPGPLNFALDLSLVLLKAKVDANDDYFDAYLALAFTSFNFSFIVVMLCLINLCLIKAKNVIYSNTDGQLSHRSTPRAPKEAPRPRAADKPACRTLRAAHHHHPRASMAKSSRSRDRRESTQCLLSA